MLAKCHSIRAYAAVQRTPFSTVTKSVSQHRTGRIALATPVATPACVGSRAAAGGMQHVQCSAATSQAETRSSQAYENLSDAEVWLVSEQKLVPITSLWGDDDRTFLVFARSMGCNFCQQLARELTQDVLPKLADKDIKLFLVSMGPPERGIEFSDLTGYPRDKLLADPENVTYDKLELKNSGPLDTFFNPKTPLTLLKRFQQDGLKSTGRALANWKPWIPTKQGQAYQQGGAFLFEGRKLIWQHYDEATGAHAEPDEILKVALQG